MTEEAHRQVEGREPPGSRPSRGSAGKIERLLGSTATAIEEIVPAVLLIVMTGIVTMDVILRYIFSRSQPWVHELALLLFVWQLFLGAAGAARRRLHIGVEFFAGLLKGRVRALQLLLAQLLMLAILGISAVLAWQFAFAARRDFEVLGVSYRWMYLAVPVGLGLFFIHVTGHAFGHLRGLVAGDGASQIRLGDPGFQEMELLRREERES